ncbi:Hypothetical predicted protein [Pelobates cultripes]|uniref:Uncharacterized protein n=1 Tax=Pelobates cultripes TaxID=61616 RepID=A0AAD1WII6_PELCU|nr:Hypothetical predicted protein [Pelobates cultripes]
MVEKQLMERTSQVKKEVGHRRQQYQGDRLKCLNPTEKVKEKVNSHHATKPWRKAPARKIKGLLRSSST